MSRFKRATFISSAGVLMLLLTVRPAEAQLAGTLNYFNPATGNWNVSSNWSRGVVPTGADDDFAVIGGASGSSGTNIATATIDSAITDVPAGISLGATV